jgi:ABC-2 type transport system ATP-binding protein
MKQKLALACTLVHEPPLLVLDEPTTGVDPVSRREFWKLLAEFLTQGLTIIVATPYLDEAERCHRVLLLSEGHRLALDLPLNLQSSLAGVVMEVVVASPRQALEVLRKALGADRVQLFGDRLHVHLPSAEGEDQIRRALETAGLSSARVRPIVPSLEDVFIEYVQSHVEHSS